MGSTLSSSILANSKEGTYVTIANNSNFIVKHSSNSVKIAEINPYTLKRGRFYDYNSPLFNRWEMENFTTNELVLSGNKVKIYTDGVRDYTVTGQLYVYHLSYDNNIVAVVKELNFRVGDRVRLYHYDNNHRVRRSKILSFNNKHLSIESS